MADYLTVDDAQERSRLEAQQRGAGLRSGDVTLYWHAWSVHPLTGQQALAAQNEADKELFTAVETAALLSQTEADAADWFVSFEV